jgi:outer membrane protein assembly factor BamB
VSSDDMSFIPEQLDQQTGKSAEHLAPDDQRLVQDLWHTYQTYEHMNAQSLQHTWERLERDRGEQHVQNMARTTPISLLRRKHDMRDIAVSGNIPHGGIKRTLSLLIAVLLVAVMVGSAAFVFTIAGKNNHHHNNTMGSGNAPVKSTPVVDASGIYITYSSDGLHEVVSKVDAQTHKPLWVYKNGPSEAGEPTVYGNTVYLNAMNDQTDQAHLIALNANTGKVLWDVPFKTNTVMYGQSGPYDLGFLTTPVVSNGQVYVMDRGGLISSFDVVTGKLNWIYKSGASAMVEGTFYDGGAPVVSDGVLYGALHNIYFAVNAKTGKQLWSHALAATDQVFNAVQILDDVIYNTSYTISGHNAGMSLQSFVYAFNTKDGKQRWNYPTQYWVTSAPSVTDGYVYFIDRSPDFTSSGISHSTLHALNAQGKEVWHKDYNTDIAGSPTVGDGYVSISEGTYNQGQVTSYTLHVYNARNGKGDWAKSVVTDPITIQDGVLYTVSGRTIIAYDLTSKKELWQGQYGVDHSATLNAITVVS